MKPQYKNYTPDTTDEKIKYPFRKGIAKKPSQKRIDKVKNRDLSSFHYMTSYLTIPWNKYGFGPVVGFVFGPVVFKFFLPQFLQKIHIFKKPVKHVDHKLDETVPFKPEHIGVYMDFVNVWVRPTAMLVHRFGPVQGAKLTGEFMRYITMAYNEAYRVYKVCMTTTYRPACDVPSIVRLRKSDPHYMCVPSLHISIVCLCFSFYRMLFDREEFTEEEKTKWNAELYKRALEIGETVLYIKQHSVNCIPAALYMVTRIIPELFNTIDAINFINDLFNDATDVTEDNKRNLKAHIQFMYERFLLEGTMEEDWTVPILRWINSYEPYTPFYA